jgi:hypothetical protein
MITLPELAALVIEVMDAQQKYFKSRQRDDLIACKVLEKELMERAREVIKQ